MTCEGWYAIKKKETWIEDTARQNRQKIPSIYFTFQNNIYFTMFLPIHWAIATTKYYYKTYKCYDKTLIPNVGCLANQWGMVIFWWGWQYFGGACLETKLMAFYASFTRIAVKFWICKN